MAYGPGSAGGALTRGRCRAGIFAARPASGWSIMFVKRSAGAERQNRMSSNVTPIAMSGGSDDGGDYGERLTRLETKVENMAETMATREDLARVEAKVETMATREDLARVETKVENMATREDLARVEAKVENMATREDLAKVQTSIAEIKTLIVQREASMLRWLLGILITTAAGMVTVLIRSFFF